MKSDLHIGIFQNFQDSRVQVRLRFFHIGVTKHDAGQRTLSAGTAYLVPASVLVLSNGELLQTFCFQKQPQLL